MRQYGGALACALVGVRLEPSEQEAAHDEIFRLATEIMSLAGVRRRVLSPANAARARDYAGRLSAMIRDSYERDDVPDRSVTQVLRARGLTFDEVEGLVAVVMVGATELIIYGLPRMLAVMVDSGALPRLAEAPERLGRRWTKPTAWLPRPTSSFGPLLRTARPAASGSAGARGCSSPCATPCGSASISLTPTCSTLTG